MQITDWLSIPESTWIRKCQLGIHEVAQRAIQGSTYERQRDTWLQARKTERNVSEKCFCGRKLKQGDRVKLFAPNKANTKKSSLHGMDHTTSFSRRQKYISKFQRMRKQRSDRSSTNIDWSRWETMRDRLKWKQYLPITKMYRAKQTTGKSTAMKTSKALHQKFCRTKAA